MNEKRLKICKRGINFSFIGTSAFASCYNFVSSKAKTMNEPTDIPAALYDDEAVCFLADRYRTSPQRILHCFFVQDGRISESEEPAAFRLENNEVELLRGLTDRINS